MQLKTLRARFALWTSALLVTVFILVGVFVYVSLASGLTQSVDDTLELAANQLRIDFLDEDAITLAEFAVDAQDFGFQDQLSWRMIDMDGQIQGTYGPYQAFQLPDIESIRQGKIAFISTLDTVMQQPVRSYSVPLMRNQQIVGVLQVTQDLVEERQTLNRLLTTFLVVGPLVIVAAGAGGYGLAAQALAPIDEIARTAKQISAEDLSARLNLVGANDEVGRLADTFDSMLDRLDRAFQRERQFITDASHELRTPLTTMRTILSNTLDRHRTSDEYEQALTDLFEESDRMRELTESLLQLARSEASGAPIKGEAIDISHLLDEVIEFFGPWAEDKDLALVAEFPDQLILIGDRKALVRLFMNVVGNAVKYTEHGQIGISAQQASDVQLIVSVTDSGPGISPEHLPFIFDRFYRVDASRTTPGTGLGLAIAQEAAKTHGGQIIAESIVGQGTTFTILLDL